jgi:glycosyltransferase involved in cell wall biosynthesis
MRYLWLTLADPEPATNGQFLYSSHLIRGVARAGVEVHVLGLRRQEHAPDINRDTPGIRWRLVEPHGRPRLAGLFSGWPQIAYHTRSRSMRDSLCALLTSLEWDAVVFDSICMGWALSDVMDHCRRRPRRPCLVYVAHNHEESVAWAISQSARPFLKQQLWKLDAIKVARLERALVRTADLVTSNSPDDAVKFSRGRADRRVEFVSPAYDGPFAGPRAINADIPRRAIIVGSFDWLPKRTSLQEFLAAAHGLFASSGVELCVVGCGEESFMARLRREFPATNFMGWVDDITRPMARARVALIPDRLGGFKLKALDYVFNRVPILGIAGSAPGVPLCPDESILLYPDHAALARGVVAIIDDFDALNRMQALAYSACQDRFDWASIGRRLVSTIGELHCSCAMAPGLPAPIPAVAL